MRPLRTIAYWMRRVIRPSSVRWTLRDNDAWEWHYWERVAGEDA